MKRAIPVRKAPTSASAVVPPSRSKAEYCRASADPDYFRRLALDPKNRLAFTNSAIGWKELGVCWWHSLFQRRALYLGIFRPELPRPDSRQAIRIIEALAHGDQVIEVPGYPHLQAFSRDWAPEINRHLEGWQTKTLRFGFGMARADWIAGSVPAAHLRAMMDRLYEEVEGQGRVVFQILSSPDPGAHAWLVVGMTRHARGYDLLVVDSNELELQRVRYVHGQTGIEYDGISSVPYTRRSNEISDLLQARQDYCNSR